MNNEGRRPKAEGKGQGDSSEVPGVQSLESVRSGSELSRIAGNWTNTPKAGYAERLYVAFAPLPPSALSLQRRCCLFRLPPPASVFGFSAFQHLIYPESALQGIRVPAIFRPPFFRLA